MRYLLILLLLSIIPINYLVAVDIYRDQTDAAILSNQPQFFACAAGYDARPAAYSNGSWKRSGYNGATDNILWTTTFPEASQQNAPRLNGVPSLGHIAQLAYVGGSNWTTNGPNVECPANGYPMGT